MKSQSTTTITRKPPTLWRIGVVAALWCLLVVSGQYYDDDNNINNNYEYPDYQDYAGEQGYDDHLYHDYAARLQDKAGGAGG